MAKTVFARKQIEEFALIKFIATGRFPNAKFPNFPENLFFGNSPCNTSYRDCKNKNHFHKPFNVYRINLFKVDMFERIKNDANLLSQNLFI